MKKDKRRWTLLYLNHRTIMSNASESVIKLGRYRYAIRPWNSAHLMFARFVDAL